jgi:hypothetical protein
MPDALSNAKAAMSKANNFTKSVEGKVPSKFAVKAKPAPTAAPAPAKPTGLAKDVSDVASGLKWKQDQVDAVAPKMHQGGIVPGELGEEVPIIAKAGEKVIPVKEAKSVGRNSDYRKVFIARRQARSGGGNKPVIETPEKHDSKKAEKSGQPAAKEAGGHVKS